MGEVEALCRVFDAGGVKECKRLLIFIWSASSAGELDS